LSRLDHDRQVRASIGRRDRFDIKRKIEVVPGRPGSLNSATEVMGITVVTEGAADLEGVLHGCMILATGWASPIRTEWCQVSLVERAIRNSSKGRDTVLPGRSRQHF
jgi:hypothetical protein